MPSVPITVKPSVVNSEKTSSRLRAANVSNACRRSADTSLVVAAVAASEHLRVLAEEHALDLADARRQAAPRHDLHHRSSTLASAVGCREGCK